MYNVICPKCDYINYFGHDCVYYDAYECYACLTKNFFEESDKTEQEHKDLENGKIEIVIGKMNYGSDL